MNSLLNVSSDFHSATNMEKNGGWGWWRLNILCFFPQFQMGIVFLWKLLGHHSGEGGWRKGKRKQGGESTGLGAQQDLEGEE